MSYFGQDPWYTSVPQEDGQGQKPPIQPPYQYVFNANGAAGTQSQAGAADNGGNQGGQVGQQQENAGAGQGGGQAGGSAQVQAAGNESDDFDDDGRQPGAYNAEWQHWW
jgi:hypothetical protein